MNKERHEAQSTNQIHRHPPPQALRVTPENIPAQLKERPQWVVWKYQWRENKQGKGKWTKPPYDPKTGRKAKSNDPRTWSSFQDALEKYTKDRRYDGIGYVFYQNDALTGVDLDHCIVEEEINPETREIILRFSDTYCEYSPSREGIRIFVLGQPERTGKGTNEKWIEVYDHTSPRYLTVTGHHIEETATSISFDQNALNWLHELYFREVFTGGGEGSKRTNKQIPLSSASLSSSSLTNSELIKQASQAKNGAKFSALYDGDIQGYASKSEAELAFCNMLAYWTNGSHSQMDDIFRSSGLMSSKWNEQRGNQTYGALTIKKAIRAHQQREKQTLQRSHNAQNSSQVASQPKGVLRAIQLPPERKENPKGLIRRYNLTDMGNGERLIARYGGSLRYCHPFRNWYVWDSKRWKPDTKKQVQTLAKGTIRAISKEIKNTQDKKEKEALFSHMLKSESRNKIFAMIEMASSEPDIPICPNELDKHNNLFNIENGTIDLSKREFRPHQKSDLITKIAPVRYIPHAPCPTWDAFLARIMDGNQALIRYLKQVAGHSFLGGNPEQIVLFFYGNGANGKGTFIKALKTLMGDYASAADFSTFLVRKDNSKPRDDLFDIRAARLVFANEPNSGGRLDEAFIKAITGSEPIKARPLYGHPVEFIPMFLPVLIGNHQPVIRGLDNGIWRRVKQIPFNITIPRKEWDLELDNKLEAELPGILNWCLEGLYDWQNNGLIEPAEVTEATREYREDMDILGQFIKECCEITKGLDIWISTDAFYSAYKRWSEQNGVKAMTKITLGKELRKKGWSSTSISREGYRGRVWHNVKLLLR